MIKIKESEPSRESQIKQMQARKKNIRINYQHHFFNIQQMAFIINPHLSYSIFLKKCFYHFKDGVNS